jgi:hypothetical protein
MTQWPYGLPRQSIRIPSRDLYPQLSALLPRPADAPHRRIVVASIRLVTQNDSPTRNTASGRVDLGYVFSGIVSTLGSRVIIPSCYRVIFGNGRAKRVPIWPRK